MSIHWRNRQLFWKGILIDGLSAKIEQKSWKRKNRICEETMKKKLKNGKSNVFWVRVNVQPVYLSFFLLIICFMYSVVNQCSHILNTQNGATRCATGKESVLARLIFLSQFLSFFFHSSSAYSFLIFRLFHFSSQRVNSDKFVFHRAISR